MNTISDCNIKLGFYRNLAISKQSLSQNQERLRKWQGKEENAEYVSYLKNNIVDDEGHVSFFRKMIDLYKKEN